MAHVEIHGRGIAFFVTEITPEIATELAETGVSDERFDELFEEELDRSDGVAAGITKGLRVLVDGEQVSVGFNDVDEVEVASTSQVAEPGKHYLLIEKVAEGCLITIDAEEPIDPSKLSKGVKKYVLPDETSITLAEFDYDVSSEFGSNLEQEEYYTVIYPNGGRQSVIFSDSGESEEAKAPVKAKRATAKKVTAKKASAKKASAKKASAKRATVKKATVKKATVKKATAKKTSAKGATAKKATAKKATAKKATAKKATAKKAAAKKATAKSATAKKATAKKANRNLRKK
jgi:pyruvate/2-oxoglutarate dehydrogenase complex dihydrolipoamide acyltransferase (E2) component